MVHVFLLSVLPTMSGTKKENNAGQFALVRISIWLMEGVYADLAFKDKSSMVFVNKVAQVTR